MSQNPHPMSISDELYEEGSLTYQQILRNRRYCRRRTPMVRDESHEEGSLTYQQLIRMRRLLRNLTVAEKEKNIIPRAK